IDQRRAAARNFDLGMDLVAPYAYGLFLACRHLFAAFLDSRGCTQPAWCRDALDLPVFAAATYAWAEALLPLVRARSFSGHHLFSHWSSHTSRKCGMTSPQNRSIFLMVRSCGIEPIWSSTIKLPTRSFFTASISC